MSNSWRNSHWSPFLHNPRSQCLQTIVLSALRCLYGQKLALWHCPLVKRVHTIAVDSNGNQNLTNILFQTWNQGEVQQTHFDVHLSTDFILTVHSRKWQILGSKLLLYIQHLVHINRNNNKCMYDFFYLKQLRCRTLYWQWAQLRYPWYPLFTKFVFLQLL